MRRFSRRRRSGGSAGDGRGAPIDADRWLQRISGEGIVPVASLAVWSHDDVPDHFAVVGRGVDGDGEEVVVSFAPRHAGDAVLAALVAGGRLAEDEGFRGEVVAVAPQWSISARRRLGLVRAELPFRLRAVSASTVADANHGVEPEAALEPVVLPVAQITAQLTREADRELFGRAAVALDGLASKHGGCIRGVGRSVELVLLARRVAELHADENGVVLTTLLPQRSSTRLTPGELAGALDGLEGQLRRRLNDRRLRDAEEGLRARVLPLLVSALSLRAALRWPLGGSDRDDVDLIGVDAEGRPVVAAARKSLGLSDLGSILDATQTLRLSLPTLFADAGAPLQLVPPRLVLAAQEFSGGVLGTLAGISLAHRLFTVRRGRQDGFELVETAAEEAARSVRERPARTRRRGGRGARGERRDGEEVRPAAEAAAENEVENEAGSGAGAEVGSGAGAEVGSRAGAEVGDPSVEGTGGAEERAEREPGAGRSRSRRRGRRGGRTSRAAEGQVAAGPPEESAAESAVQTRYEEVSLFDLDETEDGGAGQPGEETVRRRRGRSRRRGRRGSAAESGEAESDSRDETPLERQAENEAADRPRAGRGGRVREVAAEEEDDELVEDLTGALAELPEDLPGLGLPPAAEYSDEEGPEDDAEAGERERQLVLERRRRQRKAAAADRVEAPKPPRRRAVVVAQADRDSLMAAVLLARDIRLLEGLWVYPQSELMNFFREVATDLRDDVPIYVVGFVPSPARDVIQAAALYRGRLVWYDHHEWPPEDLVGLRDSIGEEAVRQSPAVGSSLPGLLEGCTRRSRFSDKLVDLATGRFTQHDYERWGRLWWWRLGHIASKTGNVRPDIEPLLSGRPSDLAKEAAKAETPPIPDEVDYVAGRDFRLVHYGGYSLVVVDVEGEHDLHLAGRIARERYGASLSLAYRRGGDRFYFGGEELSGRRTLDFGALALHLAEKLDWVEALPDDDRVARFRIRELDVHPERLDEVIGEIAMGRSILER